MFSDSLYVAHSARRWFISSSRICFISGFGCAFACLVSCFTRSAIAISTSFIFGFLFKLISLVGLYAHV